LRLDPLEDKNLNGLMYRCTVSLKFELQIKTKKKKKKLITNTFSIKQEFDSEKRPTFREIIRELDQFNQ